MTKYEIQVSEDKFSLAQAASDLIAQIVESTLKIKNSEASHVLKAWHAFWAQKRLFLMVF